MATGTIQTVAAAMAELFRIGYVEVINDRPLAVAVYRAAVACEDLMAVRGHQADDFGDALFTITADHRMPVCAGSCGEPTGNPTGMCYQCQCEAHAAGWYSQDDGKARMGRSDADIHQALEVV